MWKLQVDFPKIKKQLEDKKVTPKELVIDYGVTQEEFDLFCRTRGINFPQKDESKSQDRIYEEKLGISEELIIKITEFKDFTKENDFSLVQFKKVRNLYQTIIIDLNEKLEAVENKLHLQTNYQSYYEKSAEYFKRESDSILFSIDTRDYFSKAQIAKRFRELYLIFAKPTIANDDFLKFLANERDRLINHIRCIKTIEEFEPIKVEADELLENAIDPDSLERAFIKYRSILLSENMIDHLNDQKDKQEEIQKKIRLISISVRINLAKLLIKQKDYTYANLYLIGANSILFKYASQLIIFSEFSKLHSELEKLFEEVRFNLTSSYGPKTSSKETAESKNISPHSSPFFDKEKKYEFINEEDSIKEQKESSKEIDLKQVEENKTPLEEKTKLSLVFDAKSEKQEENSDITLSPVALMERSIILRTNFMEKSLNVTLFEVKEQEKITRNLFYVSGGIALLSGVGLGVGVGGLSLAAETGVAVGVGFISVGGALAGIVTGGVGVIIGIAAGIYCAHKRFKSLDLKELVSIFEEAQIAFNKKDYPNVMLILSRKLSRKNFLSKALYGESSIIDFNPTTVGYGGITRNTITFLNEFDLPPDAIAYTMLMVAECLIHRNVGSGYKNKSCNDEACKTLIDLMGKEEELFQNIENYRFLEAQGFWNKLKSFYWIRRYFSPDYMKDLEQKSQIRNRLSACLILARLNYALELILSNHPSPPPPSDVQIAREHLEIAKKKLELNSDVEKLLFEDFMLKKRYDVVTDFMAIMGIEPPAIKYESDLIKSSEQEEEKVYAKVRSVRRIHLLKDEKSRIHFCEVLPSVFTVNESKKSCPLQSLEKAIQGQWKEPLDKIYCTKEVFIYEVKEMSKPLEHKDSGYKCDSYLMYFDEKSNSSTVASSSSEKKKENELLSVTERLSILTEWNRKLCLKQSQSPNDQIEKEIKRVNQLITQLEKQQLAISSESKHSIPISTYEEVKVPGNGHCLYSAVGIYVGQDQKQLRGRVADELKTNLKKYESFLELKIQQTSAQYIEGVRNGSEWAGDAEIMALMHILQRSIIVVRPGENPQLRFQNPTERERLYYEVGIPILVKYNSKNHYNALILVAQSDPSASSQNQKSFFEVELTQLIKDEKLSGKDACVFIRAQRDFYCIYIKHGISQPAEKIIIKSNRQCDGLESLISLLDKRSEKSGYLLLSPEAIQIIMSTTNYTRHYPQDYPKEWKSIIHTIFKESNCDNYESWQKNFSVNSFITLTHLRFLSKLHNIKFVIFRLPVDELGIYEQSNFFAKSIVLFEGNVQQTIHTINLLNVLEEKNGHFFNHFDGLRVYEEADENYDESHRKFSEIKGNLQNTKEETEKGRLEEKLLIYATKIFLNHQKLAIKYEERNWTTDSLRHRRLMINLLEESMQKNRRYHHDLVIGTIYGYIKIMAYERALDFINQIDTKSLASSAIAELEYWKAFVYMKHNKFSDAIPCLRFSMREGFNTRKIEFRQIYLENRQKQHQFIERAKMDSDFKAMLTNRKSFQRREFKEKDSKSLVNRSSKNNLYRILSIDGGGIRGIVPCVFISEIEKRTHKPISHSFELMAGTSTGALICTGLNVKNNEDQYYSADEILTLYTLKRDVIFKKPKVKLLGNMYLTEGLEDELNTIFKEKRIIDCYSDLLVTSFSLATRQSRLFTSQAAKLNKDRNYRLKDIVRASSAAPTFFREYKIEAEVFVDGGVRLNNPTEEAYNHVIQYRKASAKEIFILSLGTGDYIPQKPLEPFEYAALLYWGLHATDLFMEGREYEIHRNLYNMFNERSHQYHRFQPLLPTPISLDAPSKNIPDLIDIAEEYLEEKYASENNEMNKIIEICSESSPSFSF